MSDLRPGKGVYITLEPELMAWAADAMNHVFENYPTMAEMEANDGNITRKQAKGILTNIKNTMSGWESTSDTFGHKTYTAYEWQGGEYRLTVVLPKPKPGENEDSPAALAVDIRFWYDPNANR